MSELWPKEFTSSLFRKILMKRFCSKCNSSCFIGDFTFPEAFSVMFHSVFIKYGIFFSDPLYLVFALRAACSWLGIFLGFGDFVCDFTENVL